MQTMMLLIGLFLIVVCSSTEDTDQQRLMKTIFKNYNRDFRPVVNSTDAVNVTLNPALYRIVDTDEAAESITLVQWFRMNWNDALLKWDPADFGYTTRLLVPITEIWYPDIFVDNTVHIEIPIPEESNNAIIEYDGTVSAEILQIITIHCKYHIGMFPFDVQNCTENVGSWMYNRDRMDIDFKKPVDLESYVQNSEFDLITMTGRRLIALYDNLTAEWSNINYDIIIQRKPSYYLLTFVLPCFMITTVSIIGIFAPFNDSGDREEKVTMGLTTLLTMTFMLTSIADKMPKSSEGLPLLGIYIMLQIAIGAVTSLAAVFIMYQNRHWTTGDPIPAWILFLTRLDRKRCHSYAHETKFTDTSTHDYNSNEMDKDGESPHEQGPKKHQSVILEDVELMVRKVVNHFYDHGEEEHLRQEWQRATQRLDLILMSIFLAINCICTICLLVVGYSNRRV